MIISMHQPQYLPWLGYFHKIDSCDLFILLDNVQYEKGGFQNRNKICTPQGEKWLTVPVITRGSLGQRIRDVKIDNLRHWQKSHWGMLYDNYKAAPYFHELSDFLSGAYSRHWDNLLDLNIAIIEHLLGYLGIKKNILLESQLDISAVRTERIIEICKKLNADTYLSGAGAKDYLEEVKFADNNIKLLFQQFVHPRYRQLSENFLPNLSMVDLIFNHGKESINILRS